MKKREKKSVSCSLLVQCAPGALTTSFHGGEHQAHRLEYQMMFAQLLGAHVDEHCRHSRVTQKEKRTSIPMDGGRLKQQPTGENMILAQMVMKNGNYEK